MSEWSFSTKEYQSGSGNSGRSFSYATVPAGTYKATIGMVKWKEWEDGGKTLKVFFNLMDADTLGATYVWDCSLVNKRNPSAQSKALSLFCQLCLQIGVDGVVESEVQNPVNRGGISGAECHIKLIVLPPNDRFPKEKNWLVGFGEDAPVYQEPSSEKIEKQAAEFDDDDIPF